MTPSRYEGTIPAMDSFKRYIKKYGIPQSVYLDKHATYKSTKKLSIEDELNNVPPLSQFERALKELDVEVIHANSSQAKGRIERLFNTFQDRLIKELRLEGAGTIDEANRALERFLASDAKRFSVQPLKMGDLHRAIPTDNGVRPFFEKGSDPIQIVAHNSKLYQIFDNTRAEKVMVEERVDGSMIIRYKDTPLKFKEITARPKKEEPKKTHECGRGRVYTPPPADHPWRSFRIHSYPQSYTYSQKETCLRVTRLSACNAQAGKQEGSQKEKELLLLTA